jgi:hypothetical protein
MVQDRRLCQRLAPSLSPLVLLDKSKYSLLFDLSEGGLAVGGFVAQDPNRVIALEFDMPDGSGYIQTQGEIVWTGDSGHRTGFRFLSLPDDSRRLLKDWISITSAARMTSIDNEVARPAHGLGMEEAQTSSRPFGGKKTERDATESSVLPLQQPEPRWNLERSFAEQNEKFNFGGTALHLASIVIMAVVISSTMAFLLGYYWRGRQPRPRVTTIAAAARSSEYPAYVPASSTPQMPPQTTTPTVLPLDNSGFVLQVGAMEQEASADALSDAVRKKNFSAFVFRRGIHDFYRVAVGPYADKGAVIRIQNDLEQEGYKSILKPWSPE